MLLIRAFRKVAGKFIKYGIHKKITARTGTKVKVTALDRVSIESLLLLGLTGGGF